MPDDSPHPIVQRLAKALLECAAEDPMLVSRRPVDSGESWLDRLNLPPPRTPTPITIVPPAREVERDVEAEHFVAMAMAAAQEAAEAAEQAKAECRAARRQMLVMAGVGTLGVLIGILGVVDHLTVAHTRQHVAALASQVADVGATQQQMTGRIDAVQASMERNSEAEQAALTALRAREAASWSQPTVNRAPVWSAPLRAPQPYGGYRPTSGAPAAWHTRYERRSSAHATRPPVWLATIINNVRTDFGALFR